MSWSKKNSYSVTLLKLYISNFCVSCMASLRITRQLMLFILIHWRNLFQVLLLISTTCSMDHFPSLLHLVILNQCYSYKIWNKGKYTDVWNCCHNVSFAKLIDIPSNFSLQWTTLQTKIKHPAIKYCFIFNRNFK